MYDNSLYPDALKAAAETIEALDALEEKLTDGFYLDVREGKLRLMNSTAGDWSPGFFSSNDIGWTFTAVYSEMQS